MADRLKMLFFDIETAPVLAYIWGQRNDFITIDKITSEWFMLSWSAKWAGQKKVHHDRLTGPEAVEQDDIRIVSTLADMIREADIVVGHNLDSFDVPKLQARLLLHQLEPLQPVRSIDTKKLSAKTFRLVSNKLDWLAQHLLGDSKTHTDFDLWKACYRGDEKALRQMDLYCRKDTVLLERVYDAMKPYVSGLPTLVTASHEGDRACPYCGEDALHKRGWYRTNASTFQKWTCGACGRCSRSRKSEKGKKLEFVPVTRMGG